MVTYLGDAQRWDARTPLPSESIPDRQEKGYRRTMGQAEWGAHATRRDWRGWDWRARVHIVWADCCLSGASGRGDWIASITCPEEIQGCSRPGQRGDGDGA